MEHVSIEQEIVALLIAPADDLDDEIGYWRRAHTHIDTEHQNEWQQPIHAWPPVPRQGLKSC